MRKVLKWNFLDFYYNRLPYKPEDIAALGLKCMPGRTIIKVEAAKIVEKNTSSSEEETRRSHMNAEAKDELCQICVCSLEGKDEYCSKRPARNVNECIRMSMLNKYRETHAPFSHEKALSYRIRRGLFIVQAESVQLMWSDQQNLFRWLVYIQIPAFF